MYFLKCGPQNIYDHTYIYNINVGAKLSKGMKESNGKRQGKEREGQKGKMLKIVNVYYMHV